MATQAAAMRAKLFSGASSSLGGMTAAAGPHTTEALRQATDRLLKEQSAAELTVTLYRQKLSEAQTAVKKLEAAYVEQNQFNAKLQARVQNDYRVLGQLTETVNRTQATYAQLTTDHQQLMLQLKEAELERAVLAADFASKAAVLSEVQAKHEASCSHGQELQDRLDDAARVRDELAAQVAGLRTELADKAQHQAVAEQRIAQLDAELAAVQSQREGLSAELASLHADLKAAEAAREQAASDFAIQLAAGASQMDQLKEELASKGAQLAELQAAKASLEAAVQEHQATAHQLDADIASLKEAAKAAESEHATALKAKSAALAELAEQHSAAMEAKLAELAAITEAKDALACELEASTQTVAKLTADLSALEEQNGATQAGQQKELVALVEELAATKQRHTKEIKALQDKHQQESDAYVERTSKNLESTMQQIKRAKAEAAEGTKAAEAAQTAADQLREQLSKERAELEARIKEREQALEDERRKAVAAAAEAAQALRAAQELAAQNAGKLDELAAELKAEKEAHQKLDAENAGNLHKLDNLNEIFCKCQDKLADSETQIGQLHKTINAKDQLLEEKAAALGGAQDRIEALEKDVELKASMLQGISAVAARVAGTGSGAEPAMAAAAGGHDAAEGRGRAAPGGLHRAAAGSQRPVKKVTIREQPTVMAASYSEQEKGSGDDEEALEEPNPHRALVPAGIPAAGANKQAEPRRSQRPLSQQAASHPIITEVDSGDEQEEDEQEDEDDRQARGRKRSGCAAATNKAAAKKPRSGAAHSGMRGLFSMQTASQNVSMGANKPKSGKATATSGAGPRKQMAAGGDRNMKNKKKSTAAVGAAMNLFGGEIFGAFGGGGYGGGAYGFDDISP